MGRAPGKMKTLHRGVLLALSSLVLLTEAHGQKEQKDKEIWGDTFKGVALSASVGRARYVVGEAPEVSLRIKNFGDKDVNVIGAAGDSRFALFNSDGRPVPKRDFAGGDEKTSPRLGNQRRSVRILKPGEEETEPIRLGRWFELNEKGDYYLVVIRCIWSWEEGFAVSNLVRFSVVEPGED